MVNHFATLLGNINLVSRQLTEVPYVLGDTDPEPDEEVSSDDGSSLISLDDTYMALKYVRTDSPLTCRHYNAIRLPEALENFRTLLYPATTSVYYKHFLLYTYLKLIASTSLQSDVFKYDNRITYDLEELQDYFRFYRNSPVVSSDPNYTLWLLGNLQPSDDLNYYLNNFVISQIGTSTEVLLFSTTQGRYYKAGKPSTESSEGMSNILTLVPGTSTTNRLYVGGTGLSFTITGPFDDPDLGFAVDGERKWSFTAETPFVFDFVAKFKELEANSGIVEAMLAYGDTTTSSNYENIWNMHYNSVYRFAGLLMCYVERLHTLWLQETS